jgi:4-diphosphocytidyl-2-C-methyl-D-erythritol kinase
MSDVQTFMKKTVQLASPAKVNLMLRVLRRRKDGYHDIKTIFQKISLHDTLGFALKRTGGVSISTNDLNLPTGESNLVHRAALLVLNRSDYKGGVTVRIRKKIPIAAGLGGGSSNAATTLKALNQLLRLDLSGSELMSMGLKLGADVPFFLMKGSALGSGIGERLQEIQLPKLWYVLIYPNFEVSTASVYEKLILTKMRFHYRIQKFFRTPKEIFYLLHNDLEKVVSREHPEINEMKECLNAAGASATLMSGSGPTVYGIFPEEGGASKAYKTITKMVRGKGWRVLKAQSVDT